MTPDDEAIKILVVDDLPEKLLVYETVLGGLGPALVTARSGEEALRAVLRDDFAVILLDVQMPGGMSGLETAALIRGRRRSAHTPIIFLTAFGADEVRAAEGYAQGAVDYISTPVVPEILRAKVRVFVDLYRMTQQVRRQAEERVAFAEERAKRAAAEEATRRSQFLAEVSRALADSLDPDTTARTLARQAVPLLADLAGVTLAGPPGTPWRTELAWATPDGPAAGRRVTAADAPRDALRDAVDRALARGTAEVLPEVEVAAPDGGPRVRSAVVLPLTARGRTLGALTLGFGPSGRTHGPADLALAEELASRAGIALDNARLHKDVQTADRQKNDFLSMLAHELRNPLAPIRNAAEVLRLTGGDDPRVTWAREVISRQLAHLVRLVDDLLDVSRITQGKIRLQPERVNLAGVAAVAVEASRPLLDARRHRLVVSLPDDPVEVTGDPTRLAQILANLLNNAAKYTDEGGEIQLTVGVEGAAAVTRVRDTGIGIAADMLGTVFDLFSQIDSTIDRSQGGLGIGLTLVRRLVELHGGRVEVASEGPGRGSEFTVRLPLVASEALTPPPGRRPGHRPAAPRGRRVVLADDNRDAAESLAELLRMDGHEVRTAHDGRAALSLAGEFRPEAVILDIGLPQLDGYEVARRLAAGRGPRPLLIAVTGFGEERDRARSREAGFDAHLTKPADPVAIRELLQGRALPQ
jgi:signal transduction histidine kinase/DNA-binding response OmpR family regulator